jgi:hypothetical protein
MKHEPSAHQPFPGVKNQRRFPVRWIASMFCLMLINSCGFSYHVKADPKLQGKPGYDLIDRKLKKIDRGWHGANASIIGANESGFSIAETTSTDVHANGYTRHGKVVTYQWSDINEIRVHGNLIGGIVLSMFTCFLIDPTLPYRTEVYFRNGTGRVIWEDDFGFEAITPAWLFMSRWADSHETARAFQTIVDSHKQNTGSTPLRKP